VTTNRTLAFLAVPALALAGCGATEIDPGKAESFIGQNIRGPAPEKIDCPDGVEAKKGATFSCDLTYPNGLPAAVVTVHIEDDAGRISIGPGDYRRQN
jgi:hypothetical protein